MSVNPVLLHPTVARSARLGDEITELFGFITAATCDLLVKIREFDRQKLWEPDGVCSCAHWLNWKCGIGMNAGREKVRVANALGDLPNISEAFRRGEISYSKVRAMTRVATPANEDYLLMIARHGTACHVETLVRGYRRAVRLNDTENANKQHDTRSLNYHYDDDGSLVINGRLPAEVGAMLIRALDKAVDRADGKEKVSAGGSEGGRPTFATRRADALAEMAESYLAHGAESSSSADRYQVMIHVSAETSDRRVSAETRDADVSAETREADERTETQGADVSAETRGVDVSAETSACRPHQGCRDGDDHPVLELDNAYIDDGPHVSAETSRRITCDCSITRIIEDDNGQSLSIGRKSRVVPAPMRRALQARNRGCRFPGCTHRYHIDAHHVEHWSQGGETSTGNLLLLCRFHHRLVHEGGFGCEKDNDGKIVFKNPLGNPIDPSGYKMPPVDDNAVVKLMEQLEDRHIHAQSCVTKWHGETMDRHLAVEHLWYLANPQGFRNARDSIVFV